MSKEMIISVNGREKKIAVLDNGKVTEFYIERGEENAGVVGNIYKGRVMRVLPGMQSAFVEIGLERDAFLYVSDFFDEEEEIERIVMEKSKKSSPEDAKREAVDHIERKRIEREKQMEAVQEIAEPMIEDGADNVLEMPVAEEALFEEVAAPFEEESQEASKSKRGRSRRGKKGKQTPESAVEETMNEVQSAPVFEVEDSGFERIIDDEDTGEMFKDAYMQEAIFDKVRAVEFDMESAAMTEVGSLIGEVSSETNGFERIADEDEEPPTEVKKSSRGSRGGKNKKKPTSTAETAKVAEKVETIEPMADAQSKKSRSQKSKKPNADVETVIEEPKTESVTKEKVETPAKKKPSRSKMRGGKKPSAKGKLEDAEASLKDSDSVAEMTARRGGRSRRGGRGRGGRTTTGEEFVSTENDYVQAENEPAEIVKEVKPEVKPEPKSEVRKEPRTDNRNEVRKEPRNTNRNESRNDNRNEGRNDNRNTSRNSERREYRPQPTITDLLREGQEILVQIAKEPIARKGARITSHIALPGRFLVYMPTIEHLGVSRKIESANERGRLRTLIQSIKREEDVPTGGFIVRTAGVGISDEDLRQDARYLVRTWLDIKKSSEKKKSPALVHQDLDIIQRLLRDHLSDEFTAIRVDSEEEYLRIVEFINRIQPKMVKRVKLYTRDEPILEAYNVQEEIDKALKPRVWLKSGGYLVINQTEALVAIDVNTGKFVGKGNARLEDTITKTNMEAVDEIARQIRLRDLGGIIVLDLIDMEDRRNRHKVSQALQEALSSDKSPTKVLSFNDFGLIIMTRKRVKQSLERTMCTPCEYCEGAGWVKSPQTICYEILEESRRLSRTVDDVRQTTLRVHPEVMTALRTSEQLVLEEIEAYLGSVDLATDATIHQNQFDFAFI